MNTSPCGHISKMHSLAAPGFDSAEPATARGHTLPTQPNDAGNNYAFVYKQNGPVIVKFLSLSVQLRFEFAGRSCTELTPEVFHIRSAPECRNSVCQFSLANYFLSRFGTVSYGFVVSGTVC